MATRESEKQLMKELEQAVIDLDNARKNAVDAKAIYDVEVAKLQKAQKEADTVAGAITALRGGPLGPANRDAIMDEARKKEKPVA